MKKSERLKSRIKIKFKYFILARTLTLFFAMVFFSPAGGPVASAADNFFNFNQESAYSEPFSKLIEFLNEKKNELEKYDGDFLGAKSFLSPADLSAEEEEEEGGNNNSSLSADEINPAVSSFASAAFESIKSFVVDNPKQYFGTVFESVKNFIFPGDSQNSFEYKSPNSESSAQEMENLKQQYAEAIDETKAISQKFNLLQKEMEKIKNSGVVVRQPIIEQKAVEKTIEKIVSGLSQTDLDSGLSNLRTELNNFNTNLLNQINTLSASSNRQTSAVYQAVSLTNKIDSLSGTRLTNITVNGVSGLTDADIPDTITASSYLPLAGGTLSGALTGTSASFSSTLTVSASTTFNGVEYKWPSADGTANQALVTNSAGGLSWTTISGGSADWNKQTNYGVLNLTASTTIPYWAKDAFYASSTSVFQGLATFGNASTTQISATNSYLGTVLSGAWNGTSIGDAYLTKSGDWTGTLDTYNGSDLLARANHTGTQGVSTLSNYDWTFLNNYGAINLTASSTKPIWAQGGINASSTSNFVYASTTALTVSGSAYIGSLNGPLQANNGLVSATTSVGSIYGGTGIDSSALTGIAQIVSGTWSASSTLSTAFGGTGWNSIQANSILLGNGAGRISTTTAGTDGFVLALSAGVPTWLATSTLSTITGTLTVAKGGTGQTSFGQGWLNSNGTDLSASTSPTVNYITATSTTATSTFPYLSITTNSNLGTVIGGTWQGTAIGDTYLTKSGDWTGTLDTYNGSDLLARANHTGTQGVSTLSNYDWTFLNNYGAINLTGSSTKPIWAQGGINASSTSNFVYASTTALTVSGSAYIGSLNGPLQANNGLVSATTSVGSIYGGTGLDSSALTGLAQIVAGTWSASSTLSAAFGGTGWNSLQANTVLLGNGSGRISTTTAGTDGYVLALSAGVPTWLATSTLSTITGTLTVAKGGTGQTSFGQGWLNSNGTDLSASTSPTVNYLTATSTTATSTFPYLSVTTNSNLGTVVGGTWQGTAIGDTYLTKSGDWTGTLDTYNGSDLLARANHTGTQGVATLSNYDWTFSNNYGAINLTASSTKPLWAQGGLNASSTSNFVYASTTALTISGNSYLGTVQSGAWNGSVITDPYISSAVAWNNKWDLASSTIPVNKGGTGLTSGYNNTNWDTAYTNRITSATYPLSISSNNMSLAFGTTTSNLWAGTQTFGNTISGSVSGNAGTVTNGVYTTDTGTVTNTMLANSTISGVVLGGTLANLTATDGSLTFSGTYTGATARTIGLNLGNANTWTALQTFGNASTTQIGSTGSAYFATGGGNVGIGTTAPGAKLHISNDDSSGFNSGQLWVGSSDGQQKTIVGYDTSGDFGYIIADDRSVGYDSLVINPYGGNVGIGTTSPNYKLQVAGDIAATAFINTSTKTAKKDIAYLSSSQEEDFLDKIKNTNIANYHYNIENENNPLRLGLIAEEAPSEILSADGKGVDVYKMATFTLGGVKALQKEMEGLKIDIVALSANSVASAGTGSDGLFAWITDKFKTAFGITFGQDKIGAKNLCAKKSNGDEVCIDGDKLQELLDKNNISQTTSLSSASSSSSSAAEGSSSSSVVSSGGGGAQAPSENSSSSSLPAGEAGSIASSSSESSSSASSESSASSISESSSSSSSSEAVSSSSVSSESSSNLPVGEASSSSEISSFGSEISVASSEPAP